MQTKESESKRVTRVRAALLLAASAAALVLPARWHPGMDSATPGEPTGLVVTAAGWVAWALTIYLAVGVGVAATGYLLGFERSCARFAPRPLRRFVEVAVGASSVALIALAPAAAYADAPPPAPLTTASPLDWPGLAPAPTHPPSPIRPPSPISPISTGNRPSTAAQRAHAQRAQPLVVHPGDSLWSLTERELGPDASAAWIAAEWPRLYAANRRAIGADPGLIHPGQQLVPPPSQGRTSR